MNRTPKTQRRKLKALTDPRPEFVSLVSAGANQTPFLVVKSDEPAAKSDTHDIVGIRFQAANFPDEAAVKAWLDEGGYEDYEITKADNGDFTVGSDEIDAEDSRMSVIDMDGLSVFVMKREEASGDLAETQGASVETVDGQQAVKEDEKAEAEEPAVADEAAKEEAPAAEVEETAAEKSELRVKFDDFMAHYSNGETLNKVLEDGFDGVPPGFYDVMHAMHTAVRNCIVGGDLEGVRRVAAEFGDLVVNLVSVFPVASMTEAQRADLATTIAPDITIAGPVETPAAKDEETPAAAEAEAEETAKTDEAVQPVAQEEAVEAEKAEEAATPEAEAEPAVEEAPAAKSDLEIQMATLVAAVAQLTTQVGSLHSDLTTKADALAVRVDAIEGRQTRKSADVEDGVSASSTTAKKSGSKEFQDLALRGVLGIARRSN